MKNLYKFLGIITIVAVIGFSVIGCSAEDDGGGSSGGNNSGDNSGGNDSGGNNTGGNNTGGNNSGGNDSGGNNSGGNNTGGNDSGGNNTGGNNQGGGDTAVTFSGVTANGSSSQSTTQLTLTFSQAITGLSASDISLSGVSVTKGTLSGSGPSYTLGISGQTAGGTLTVAVSKSGYTISSSSRTVTIYYYTSSSGGTSKPSTPTGVTATATSPINIKISWNVVSGATSYKVYCGVGPYSTFTQLLGTTTTNSIIDDDVEPGETWYYKVSAVNSNGESALSTVVSATTPSILGKWYTTQSAANAGTGTPTYEFLSNGNFYISGLAAGTFTDNYSASGATGNTVIIRSGGTTLGTATFSLSGTSMTITSAGTSGLSTGTYYKKAN